ncbi:MAG: ArsR/SmtB family transcription factor [Candidatus Sumerlaeaceae bacterium]
MKRRSLTPLSFLFRALGDPVRLRLLHLLSVEELSVGELVRILDLPQSSVSRQISVLREQGLLSSRPAGPATYYRTNLESDVGDSETALRDSLTDLLRHAELAPADQRALERVLAGRESAGEQFFDRIGLGWDSLREECFGTTFHLEAFIALLPKSWTVADLGTGTGYLLPILGRHFNRVIGIDNSHAMLELARKRVEEADVARRVELSEGALEKLPLKNAEVDLAIALLMLHHLPDVEIALREVRRVLKPGGKLLVVEIHEHQNEAFRVRMADRRPGIAPAQLEGWMRDANLEVGTMWDIPSAEHAEHELAPVPQLYVSIAGLAVPTEAKHNAEQVALTGA